MERTFRFSYDVTVEDTKDDPNLEDEIVRLAETIARREIAEGGELHVEEVL